MKKYKTLIFDFDGTIADSLAITVKIYNELAELYNGKLITSKDVEGLRDSSIQEITRKLGIPAIKVPFYIYKGRSLFKKYTPELEIIKGIDRVITELSKSYHLGILTSNTKENVEFFLQRYSLDSFNFIHSEKNLFGKHKALLHLIQEHSIDIRSVLYIGDEIRDIDSCHKVSVDIAAVCWGYNSHSALRSRHPTYLLDTPHDLKKLLL